MYKILWDKSIGQIVAAISCVNHFLCENNSVTYMSQCGINVTVASVKALEASVQRLATRDSPKMRSEVLCG